MSVRYEPEVYRRFAELLPSALKHVPSVSMRELRRQAYKTAVWTRFGSPCWRSAVSSRMAAKTVFLGGEITHLPRPSQVQQDIIAKAPETLHKVLGLVRDLPMVHVQRQMADNDTFNPLCNLYCSVADLKSWRMAYMWANTLNDPDPKRHPGPAFTMIHIPDEHPLRMQVLSLPEHNINIALGTDYTGEEKKGFLRQAMFRADLRGMLGLHAGSKLVKVWDAKEDRLKTYGVYLFGLTATGKSTWSCHQLGLDWERGEKTLVAQDDICFLRRDGGSYGSEPQGFYVKTDVDPRLQEAMYNALADRSALLENLMVRADGTVDFLDERLGENGRGVLRRDKVRIRHRGRMVSISAPSIDIPPLEELDGLIFCFITRRHTVVPFAAELSPEQGVLAYLWGESTHSFATNPAKAGDSVHVVGMDDFIVGPQGRKVNFFHDVVMDLCARYPGKVKFFQYNTGGMGEIIVDEGGKKKLVRKVERVPLDLMAALQRGDLRGTSTKEVGRFGTREVVACEGGDLGPYRPRNYYSEAQIEGYVADLVRSRRDFTHKLLEEGMRQEIADLAEQNFDVCMRGMKHSQRREADKPAAPAGQAAAREEPLPSLFSSPWRPTFRPPRSLSGGF